MEPNDQNINRPAASSGAPQEGTRKLTAIMFTDIKEFTKKMQKDESKTMSMLHTHNRMMTDSVIKHGGTVIKTIGDAFLISFDSIINAALCAIEVQQNFYDYNSRVQSDDDKITVRIGVHLGDVIVQENDVFGDGVNIASRIQSIAEAGGVNISESVYQQIKNKIDVHVINLGLPQLKGISDRIKIYQVIIIPTGKTRGKIATQLYVLKTILKRKRTQHIIETALVLAGVMVFIWLTYLAPTAPQNSLAVLPFRNIGDQSNEYYANGFTEEMVTYLSQLTGFRVMSQGSSFEYKNSGFSEKEIAKKLDVHYILTGTIQITTDGISINARLTDPSDGTNLWAQKFDRSKDEILSIQHDIFRQIALRLELSLATSEKISSTSKEAYDLYLRGLEYGRKEKKDAQQLAISFYEQAIKKDTNFLQGYIKLASNQLGNYERGYDFDEKWTTEAETNIKKAFTLDSLNAEAYWVMGRLEIIKGKRQKGLEILEKSIQMNPNLMRAYLSIGNQYLTFLNKPSTAITYYSKAYELEPTNYNTLSDLGSAYYFLKNYKEAIKTYRRAAYLYPSESTIWLNLGVTFERLAEYDSAQFAYRIALQCDPADIDATEFLSALLLLDNNSSEAKSVSKTSLGYEPDNYRLLYIYGLAYSQSGRKDSASLIWKDGLKLADIMISKNPRISQHHLYAGLFSARLGLREKAIDNIKNAVALDSSDVNVLGMARIYSILSEKQKMIDWFARAKAMNSDYDDVFLKTALDFEKFRNDRDLIFTTRH